MKATHIHKKGFPVCFVRVKFMVDAFTIEQAIIWTWTIGKKATVKEIRDVIDSMFHGGGAGSPASWNQEQEVEEYQAKAKEHAQKLFPSFYKTTQQ
jgi:hypothetical protein